MTNALFSPRSEEIHRSEIGEILLSQMIERGDFKQVKRGVCRMRGPVSAASMTNAHILYTLLEFAIGFAAFMAGWYALHMAAEKLKQ